jgi:hypothetical protein
MTPPLGPSGWRDKGRVKCEDRDRVSAAYESSAFERDRLTHCERSGFVGASRWAVDRAGRRTYMISRGDGPCPTGLRSIGGPHPSLDVRQARPVAVIALAPAIYDRDAFASSRSCRAAEGGTGAGVPAVATRPRTPLDVADSHALSRIAAFRMASWSRGVTLLGDATSCVSLLGDGSSSAMGRCCCRSMASSHKSTRSSPSLGSRWYRSKKPPSSSRASSVDIQ